MVFEYEEREPLKCLLLERTPDNVVSKEIIIPKSGPYKYGFAGGIPLLKDEMNFYFNCRFASTMSREKGGKHEEQRAFYVRKNNDDYWAPLFSNPLVVSFGDIAWLEKGEVVQFGITQNCGRTLTFDREYLAMYWMN